MVRKRLLRFETEISWFGLASALDVAITFLALRSSAVGQTQLTIVESNPIAQWVLHRWGFVGMGIFKLLMALIVIVIAEVVGRSRPIVGRGLLIGGTLVVSAVVVYSVRLLLQHRVAVVFLPEMIGLL